MPLDFTTPVQYVKRIGDRVAHSLAERGIFTIEDLLYHLPFRYEDRLHPKPLHAYQPGDMASVVGEVRGTVLLRTRSAPIFEMTIGILPPASASNDVSSRPQSKRSADGAERPAVSSMLQDASMAGLLQPPPVLETIKCLWFHGAYLRDKFKPGQRIALYGKLESSRSGNARNAVPGSTKFKMIQPTFEILPDANATGEDAEFTVLEMGRIVPVYESLGGTTAWGAKLGSRWLRRVLWTIFRELEESSTAAAQQETLPHALAERLHLPTRMAALRDIHFPPAGTSLSELQTARTPAHRRLIFEELFYLELGLELKRRRMRERAGTPFRADDKVRAALKQILPFKPTTAQKRVLGEIVADMRQPHPMRRLLQGDVGSGKTIVALEAALVAIENGFQAALMAPTEILATQHYLSARKLLANAVSPSTGKLYRITLLSGSLDERAKREARARLFRGETDLAIGTHALVEEKVDFANLGLVIVDEQHRFGVEQRFQLMRKPNTGASEATTLDPESATNQGAPSSPTASSSAKVGRHNPETSTEPDVLVMTATPIPRTLALTMYGDLETSVLDELPPGRTPIVTRRMTSARASEVWEFVRKQVALGRQAYIVYPVIEGERDDQPELDFAQDQTDSADQPANTAATQPGNNAGAPFFALPEARTKSQSIRAKGGVSGAARPLFASPGKKPTARSQASLAANTHKSRPLNLTRKPKLRSATESFNDLQNGPLAGLKLGLLHGRMSADDKDVTMARFRRGEIDVLISTTVIEVGVDVPNATLMVIDHADRFGLAQLHQLRGRVGRGTHKSFCVLLSDDKITPEAEARLDAMVRTENGFELAEFDLAQRGPGEFFGTRQAGLPDFRVASLVRDRDLLELAKAEAARFAESPDPAISQPERDAVWSRLKQQWQRRYGLVEA